MTERKELSNDEVNVQNKSGVNLVQKIVKAIENAKDIKEDGWNGYSKYTYITDKQVSKVARKLTEQGVIVIPSLSIVDRWKDGKNNFVQVEGKYTLTDGNQSFHAKCDGIGADTLDKGVYKAETGAKKNFFMQLMLLSSDEDTDDDHGKGIEHQQSNQNYQQNNNYQSSNQPKASANKKASDGQVNFIKSLASKSNRDYFNNKDAYDKSIKLAQNDSALHELTSQQASKFINFFQNK